MNRYFAVKGIEANSTSFSQRWCKLLQNTFSCRGRQNKAGPCVCRKTNSVRNKTDIGLEIEKSGEDNHVTSSTIVCYQSLLKSLHHSFVVLRWRHMKLLFSNSHSTPSRAIFRYCLILLHCHEVVILARTNSLPILRTKWHTSTKLYVNMLHALGLWKLNAFSPFGHSFANERHLFSLQDASILNCPSRRHSRRTREEKGGRKEWGDRKKRKKKKQRKRGEQRETKGKAGAVQDSEGR